MKTLSYKTILSSIAVMAFAALVSCGKNEPDPVPPGPDPGTETADTLAAPVLEKSAITDSSFTISWEAVENAEGYVYDFGGEEKSTAETSVDFSGLEAETDYTVRVKATSSAENTADSEWSEITVTTLEKEEEPDIPVEEGLTFTVTDDDITSTYIYMTVIPSDETAQYSYILTDTKTVEGYSDLSELAYLLINISGEMEILQGTQPMLFEVNIRPAHQYTLLLFGYEGTEITSEVFRHDVETPEGEINEGMTFDMFAEVEGPTSIYVDIYPSDNEAYYFYNVITLEEYEYYKDDLTQYIRDVCADVGISIDRYMRQFASVGPEDYTFTGLDPDTEYILFAAGCELLDNDVRFFTPQLYEGELRTPPVSSGVEDLTFTELQFSVGAKGVFTMITPSNLSTTYVYSFMTVEEYGTYINDMEGYFSMLASEEGLSLAGYIQGNMVSGKISETLPITLEGGYSYKLMAVGVSLVGTNVTFGTPQATSYAVPVN